MKTIHIPRYTVREFALGLALCVLLILFGEWFTTHEPSPGSRRYELIKTWHVPMGLGLAALGLLGLARMTYDLVTGAAVRTIISLTSTELLDHRFDLLIPWGSVRRVVYPSQQKDGDEPSGIVVLFRRPTLDQYHKQYIRATVVAFLYWCSPGSSEGDPLERYVLQLPTHTRDVRYRAKLRAAIEARTGLYAFPIPADEMRSLIQGDNTTMISERFPL